MTTFSASIVVGLPAFVGKTANDETYYDPKPVFEKQAEAGGGLSLRKWGKKSRF